MQTQTGIIENILFEKYHEALDVLLRDHTTQKNIFWATNDYQDLGESYTFNSEITANLIIEGNNRIIIPRVLKDITLQQIRSKEMAEVFTPTWLCNSQNNLIDNVWFGRKNVFNIEENVDNISKTWSANPEKICFPKDKSWKDYILDNRLEITCGEAPYIISRYNTSTGNLIPIENRIGLLDRKLRMINENVETSGEWLRAVQSAYKSIYAFEWQGDSLFLAREAMLITFIENFKYKFNKNPQPKSVKYIAYIISWNIWQMDGLKGVIPNSCKKKVSTSYNLFGETISREITCKGCIENNIHKHNGIYSKIKDWTKKDLETGKLGRKIKFVNMLKS